MCAQDNDFGSRVLLEEILVSEEEHIDWLEAQLGLIEQLGLENYLAEQMHEEGDTYRASSSDNVKTNEGGSTSVSTKQPKFAPPLQLECAFPEAFVRRGLILAVAPWPALL